VFDLLLFAAVLYSLVGLPPVRGDKRYSLYVCLVNWDLCALLLTVCCIAVIINYGDFSDFFASCVFSEPRAAGFRPASEIRTKATPCVEIWQTSNLRPLRLGEEKKKERRKIEITGQKYNGLPYYIRRP